MYLLVLDEGHQLPAHGPEAVPLPQQGGNQFAAALHPAGQQTALNGHAGFILHGGNRLFRGSRFPLRQGDGVILAGIQYGGMGRPLNGTVRPEGGGLSLAGDRLSVRPGQGKGRSLGQAPPAPRGAEGDGNLFLTALPEPFHLTFHHSFPPLDSFSPIISRSLAVSM